MKKRAISIFVLTCLLFQVSPCMAEAHNRNVHDRELEMVLFGKKSVKDADECCQALADAAYLCIDQFHGAGEKQLYALSEFVIDTRRINNLPAIEEIDISGSETNHHREFTHKGWAANYNEVQHNEKKEDVDWQKQWEKRKRILQDTVNVVFNLNPWANTPVVGKLIPYEDPYMDSFCALVYYIHLIGDHEVTSNYDQYKYLMQLGGKWNEKDIIHELEKSFEVLFEDRKRSSDYIHLIDEMENLNTDIRKYGKVTETEDLEKNRKYAEELLEILEKYVPRLLKEEKFFSDVFYPAKVA